MSKSSSWWQHQYYTCYKFYILEQRSPPQKKNICGFIAGQRWMSHFAWKCWCGPSGGFSKSCSLIRPLRFFFLSKDWKRFHCPQWEGQNCLKGVENSFPSVLGVASLQNRLFFETKEPPTHPFFWNIHIATLKWVFVASISSYFNMGIKQPLLRWKQV